MKMSRSSSNGYFNRPRALPRTTPTQYRCMHSRTFATVRVALSELADLENRYLAAALRMPS